MKTFYNLPHPQLQYYFKRSLKLFTFCFLLVMIVVPESTIQACMGTPRPPCGRSVFLGKFTPGVVVFPAAGAITVPIGVLPFAQWNISPLCAQPTAATLSLTLTCFPSGNVIGPQTFPAAIATPTIPGAQPIPGRNRKLCNPGRHLSIRYSSSTVCSCGNLYGYFLRWCHVIIYWRH